MTFFLLKSVAQKGLVFVTHDKDFSELGAEILTANEKLVSKGKGEHTAQ